MSSKCLNSFNEFYLKEFNKMISDAREKNSKNLMVIYKKVALSIEKYPFPILTASQTLMLEGVGENISKQFENLIAAYKEKIRRENINYIEAAYQVNENRKAKKMTKKRKAETDDENLNRSNMKSRKKLINIDSYSSLWTTIVSSYIVYLQTNRFILDINDILAMATTITSELKKLITVENSEGTKDFKQMKGLNLIEEIDIKDNKVKINEFLITFSKIELKKSGIAIEYDENGAFNFSVNEVKSKDKTGFETKAKKMSSPNKKSASSKKNMTMDSFLAKEKKFNEDTTSFTYGATNLADISFNENSNNNLSTTNVSIKNESIKNRFEIFTKVDTYDTSGVILLIDNRESGSNNENFKEEIENRVPDQIRIEQRNLVIGDFMWIYKDPATDEEFVLDYVIERKTLNDLAVSIIDGRYKEQKYRLKNTKISNVYYIFEGTNYANHFNLSKSALNSAIYHTVNIHDMNSIRTNSTQDSVNFIMRMNDFIKKHFKFLINEGRKVSLAEFISNNAKTKNSSVESIFLRQLRCFDDCGMKSIEIIRQAFKCPKLLYDILKKCDEDPTLVKENIINVASYLIENGCEINEVTLLKHIKEENLSKIKKGLKSAKKIRKTANEMIIQFYSSSALSFNI